MTRLEKLCHKVSHDARRVNIVIVPGNGGSSLQDQTCSHFPAWLENVVAKRDRCMIVWTFHHDIVIENLESWSAFCEAGEHLLQNLRNLQQGGPEDDGLSDEDSLILIGHKLGSFVLKKALIEANRHSNKPHMNALLENIETLVMLGDPYLHPDNQSEWISLISKILPYKTMPQHLSCPQAAECLAKVADCFEDFTLHSTLFQVAGTSESKRKHLSKLQRHVEKNRCICSADLSVRMWTTTAEEVAVEPGQGTRKECAFNPQSPLYQQLVSIPRLNNPLLTQASSAVPRVLRWEILYAQGNSLTDGNRQAKLVELPTATAPQGHPKAPSEISVEAAPLSPETCYEVSPELPLALVHGLEESLVAPPEEPSELASALQEPVEPPPTDSSTSAPALDEPLVAPPVSTVVQTSSSAPVNLAHKLHISLESTRGAGLVDEHVLSGKEMSISDSASGSSTSSIHSPLGGVDTKTLTPDAISDVLLKQHPSNNNSITPLSKNAFVQNESRPRRRHRFFSTSIPERDLMFNGRENILDLVTGFLLPLQDAPGRQVNVLPSSNIVVLQGLPGVGKSAIALESAYRIQQKFDHVFWLQADSELHLAQSFHDAARSLKLVQGATDHDHARSRQSFLTWTQDTSATWLLILNNADEPQILAPFVPHIRQGSVILTTRRPLSDELDLEGIRHMRVLPIPVEPLDIVESTAFLRSFSIDPMSAKIHELRAIAEQCRYLPLMLRRIGTIIRNLALSGDRHATGRLERSITMRDLYAQPSGPFDLSEQAYHILRVMTFFDCSDVDEAIMLGAQRCVGLPSMPLPMTDEDYSSSKGELLFNAIISQTKPNSLAMNRVVQTAVRAKLSSIERAQAFRWACLLLWARWPSRKKIRNIVLGNWPEFDSLHSHTHELTNVFVEHEQSTSVAASGENDLLNNTYVKILMYSTWFNALRGNAKEDQNLIHLAHSLLTRSSMRNSSSKLEQATKLPRRLIDCGSDGPRLVDTAGQTGSYVAISHFCASSRTRLMRSNLARLRRKIETPDIQDSWRAAIEMTRGLGVRYLWINDLCTMQDDTREKTDAITSVEKIYTSAVCTISEAVEDGTDVESRNKTAVLVKPFLVYLNWSEPEKARVCWGRLQTPSWSWSTRCWTEQEFRLNSAGSLLSAFAAASVGPVADEEVSVRASGNGCSDSSTSRSKSSRNDTVSWDTRIHEQRAQPNVHYSLAELDAKQLAAVDLSIEEGIRYAKVGKHFEALARFIAAKEVACAYKNPSVGSWKIHVKASVNLALVYLMQNMPAIALDMLETVMKFHDKTPVPSGSSAPVLWELHFAAGQIHNALNKSDKSLASYVKAGENMERVVDPDPALADWKAALGVKMAEHQLKAKEYETARASLQRSLAHFEKQDTTSAQAHLARILHLQSLILEANGSNFMSDAMRAAAKHTWGKVRSARGLSVPESTALLTTDDFDAEIEYWFR